MTTTETQLTDGQKLDELLSKSKSMQERIDKLSEAQIPGLQFHQDDNGIVARYWEDAGEDITFDPKQGIAAHMRPRRKSMPKGYQGAQKAGFDSFGSFLKSGMANHTSNDWKGQHGSIFKAIEGMSEQVATDGGYLVPPEFAAEILERTYVNDLWSLTDNYTVGGNGMTFTRNAETSRADGSRHGGLLAYWLGEGATIPDTNPTMKPISLRLKKLAVVVYLTNELAQDAPAAEAHARKKAREEFSFMLGDAVVEGNDVGMPLGYMNSGALNTITKETSQTANTVVVENIDKMWARRLVRGGNYIWLHNQDVCPQLDQLAQDVGTGGLPLYRPNGSVAGMVPQSLKGAPRLETEFNETLGTKGDIALVDLGQMLSISKAGITEDASIHVQFLTDQTALRFTMRADCRPWEDTPCTPFKGSNTQSAFNVIATRA